MSESEYWDLWQFVCKELRVKNLDFDSYYALDYIKLKQNYPNILDIIENINKEIEDSCNVYIVWDEDDNTLSLEEY